MADDAVADRRRCRIGQDLSTAAAAQARRAAGGPDRVLKQHRDRHRADAAGHRRDRSGDLARRLEVDVARPGRRRFGSCRRRSPRRRASPNRRATSRGEPTAATRMSARRHTAARSAVREWQTVTVAFAFKQQAGQRPADQDRAADYDRLGAGGLDPGVRQELHHPLGRARNESRTALGQQAGAARGQAVDVLGRIDRARSPRPGRSRSGSGSWTRIPSTSSSRAQLLDQVERARPGRRRGLEFVMDRAHPDLLGAAGACCERRLARQGRRRRAPWRAPGTALVGGLELDRPRRRPARAPRPRPPCRRSRRRSSESSIRARPTASRH